MGTFVALYQNFSAVGGAFSGGLWSLPLTNLQNTDLGQIARSQDISNSSTTFDIDLGAERAVGGFAIGPTNMTPGSSYRIRSFTDAFSSVLYDSGVKQIPGLTVDSLDLEWEDPGFWYGIGDITFTDVTDTPWIIEVIPEADEADAVARYWRVDLFDDLNPEGFIEIGYCLVGRAFRPTFNFDEQNTVSREELTDVAESLGGRRDYWNRGSRRTLRVSWPYLSSAEGWSDLYRMSKALGISEPLFVVPDPDDTENLQKRSFLASFSQSPEMRLLLEARVSTAFDLEEWL